MATRQPLSYKIKSNLYLESKPSVIATVINDVIYDQRMGRVCVSLSKDYNVSLWGRKKSNSKIKEQPFAQKRFSFLVNSGPLFYLLYNIKIFVHLLFARVDIIHSVDLDTLPAGYFASVLRGKKLVYDSHEYYTEVPELVKRPFKRKIWLFIEQRILPKVKNAITVGQSIAEEYSNKYGVSFKVVRNCPYLKPLPNKTTSEKYLVYQGALNAGRGLENLIIAMKDIPMKLKIAGTGDLDLLLKILVDEGNLGHKVEFLGMVPPSELPQLAGNAFAGINVSENLGLSYYLSLNNKYFDYIHAGIPAITNPFPEYQLLEKQTRCSVFAHSNPKEIIRAVNLLLDDDALYDKIKKNCLLARQELTWKKEEKILLNLYANLA